jgi:hypothetical protein
MTQYPAPLNHAQDDFSAGSSSFAVIMGGFGLRQWKLLVDDDLQLSGVDQTANFLQPDAVHVAAFEPRRDAVLFRQCLVRRRYDTEKQTALLDEHK